MSQRELEKEFGQYLVAQGLLAETLLRQAEEVCEENFDSLAHSLAKLGFIPQSRLADALACFRGLPRHSGPIHIVASPLNLSIPFLAHHLIAPIALTDESIDLVIANPLDDASVQGVEFATARRIAVHVATIDELDAVFAGLPTEGAPSNEQRLGLDSLELLRDLASDAPAIRLVQRLITSAVDRHASDIHIEAVESSLKVRLRLDGVLHDMENLPNSIANAVISRIKVMAQLNIAERRLPQDGRLTITVNGKPIDFRVATSPTLHGESVVLRILDRNEVELDFERLGFDATVLRVMRAALDKPFGIILSTGPTGSGKTTTLYTALKELNRPERKILTVEDPIEYMMEGVNQTQVKPQIGYSFAAAIRAFLRQDPDVLMVGEIRDRETAEIAIQAALTGHLLLSTLHTNSAAAAITRLLDMGIDDFLLTSTLNLIIGQRLVRRLCARCREPFEPTLPQINRFKLNETSTPLLLYRPHGCSHCGGLGYTGRTGIVELLEMTEPVKQAALARADAQSIEREAVGLGMRTMYRHGTELALRGVTTMEEVLRVTSAVE